MTRAVPRFRPLATFVACAFLYLTGCGSPESTDGLLRLVDVWITPPGTGFPQRRVTLEAISRLGIPLRPGGAVERFRLRIPRAARFDALLGVSKGKDADPETATRVELRASICSLGRPGEEPPALARFSLDGVGWHPIAFELGGYAGQELELCLGTRASGDVDVILARGRIGTPGARSWPTERPNLVVVTRDAAIEPDAGSSAVERLAADGERYSNAITNSPGTFSVHASFFTGKYPRALRVQRDAQGVLSLAEGELTLAERFHALGYSTGAFVASPALGVHSGLAQGFALLVDRPEAHPTADAGAGDLTDQAVRWLDDADRPFLLFLRDRVPASAAIAEERLQRLLEGLKKRHAYDETLVVVVSTEQALPSPHDADTAAYRPRVARAADVIVKPPKMDDRYPRGRAFSHRIDLLDVHASILRELGLATGPEGPLDARSDERLRGIPAHGLRRRSAVHLAEHIGSLEATSPGPTNGRARNLEAVYHDRLALVRSDRGELELFALDVDPARRIDPTEIEPDALAGLEAELDAWAEDSPPAWRTGAIHRIAR